MASSFTRFLDHTQRRTTARRTPLDEWSACLNTQHSQQTFMRPVGFEPTISAGERPKTYALDRAANGTGIISRLPSINKWPPRTADVKGRTGGCRVSVRLSCRAQEMTDGKSELHPHWATQLLQFFCLFATAAQHEAWSRTLQRLSKSSLSAPASCFENFRFECQTTDQLSRYSSWISVENLGKDFSDLRLALLFHILRGPRSRLQQ
jgi:hypothetical protein